MPVPPQVQAPAAVLGATAPNGIAASIYGLVDRGISRRPALAAQIRGEVELRFEEDLAPVRLAFEEGVVTVEDGPASSPDLVVSGRLPHIVALTTAPLLGGVPNPVARRGRAALARVADGRVKLGGDRALARQLLRLLAL